MVRSYACVTHATSAAKPSIWSFSFSSASCETNIGKEQFLTPSFLIRLLNHCCTSSQMKKEAGYAGVSMRLVIETASYLQNITARYIIIIKHITFRQYLLVPPRKVLLL